MNWQDYSAFRRSLHSQWKPPTDPEQLTYWAMLEAIGFQCWRFGDAPTGTTEKEIKSFLKANRDRITCEPPDYIAAVAGGYDFILNKEAKT